LRGVNLAIGNGELRCIIGPNGCGKTTLFNIISGAFPPSSGTVLFRGEDITGRSPHLISRLGISRKFQVPGIYPSLAVAENLEVPLVSREGIAGPWPLLRAGARAAPRLRELIARFALQRSALRAAGALPHGQKQWLEIAMLLMQEPKLLVLDEPVAGMSDEETERTAELFISLAGEHSLVVVEHDMSFIHALTQDNPRKKVTVLHEGRVLAEGPLAQVQANEQVVEVYLGR